MINWLSKATFYTGAVIALLSIILLITSKLLESDSEIAFAGNTELILVFIPKFLLAISAFFLLRRNKKGLYILYSAFAASIIHSVYVLGVLESGKRYIEGIQFLQGSHVYWIFKSFFYIVPLFLYLVWIVYWFRELKHNKQSQKRTVTPPLL